MKPTYEELEAKCQLQQNKLDAINKLMGVIEGASDLAKSGIEKLEQQLAVAISERDAAVKAERVWEKSMMEACGEDGPASVAAEIAALRALRDTALESLRQQLAAVVAENAGLKDGALQEIEVINRGGQAYCVKDGMSVSPIYARGWNDYRAKSLSVETPATDAYLAEVRAQGVEMLLASLPAHYTARADIESFAAQLRQGVAL